MKLLQLFKKIDINAFFLKILLLPKILYRKMGIDTEILANIVGTKLTLDSRRPFGAMGMAQQGLKKSFKATWIVQAIMFLLMGFIYILFLVLPDQFSAHFLYFSVLMLMVILTTVLDFSTALFDGKDTFIIFTKPVNDATISMSRFLHILIYILKQILVMALPGIIFMFVEHGVLAGLIFILQVKIAAIVALLIICAIYLLIFKVKNIYTVKKMLANMQIAFTMLIVTQYYFLPRLADAQIIDHLQLSSQKFIYFIPSAWIAQIQPVLFGGKLQIAAVLMAILGLVSPFLFLWIYIKYISKTFNQKISLLALSAGTEEKNEKLNINTKKIPLEDRWAPLLTQNDTENSAFRTVWKLSSRFTDFKMRMYPSFGFIVIFMAFMFFNIHGDMAHKLSVIRSHPYFLIVIYYSGMILSGAFINLSISPQYKASWVYFVTPVSEPGSILSGAYKAICIKYFTPMYIVIMVAGVFIFGSTVINDFILGYFALLCLFVVINLFFYNTIPFSAPIQYSKSKWYLGFVFMFIQVMIAGLHYFFYRWEIVIWAFIPMAIFIFWMMMKQYKKQTWKEITIYSGD